MRYQTELMRSILTNEKAQKIIDYVSPIYGESYVALWIYQAMGVVLGEIYDMAAQLRYETTPATADLLLDYWEQHYGIITDPDSTAEQRRARLATKTSSRGPCNPAKLEKAVSAALGGVKVEITENVAKNTFLVNIREVVYDITPAVAVLEVMKQAHTIYRIQITTQMVAESVIKAAVAVVHTEMNRVNVQYEIPKLFFSLDVNGVLVGSNTPTLLDDGTLVYNPLPNLTENGTLTN